MIVKLLSTIILFTSQYGFSQTEKRIKGKVIFNTYAVQNVEIINATTKTITRSDVNGAFSIVVKTNDIIVFIAKEYQQKNIPITPQILNNTDLTIELVLKAEELNEIVISNMPSIKLGTDLNWEQKKLDKLAFDKSVNTIKIVGYNNGTIENGMDFMKIGGKLFRLFAKEKKPKKKEIPIIPFKETMKDKLDQKFYLETLKLKPDEIELFLQFCEADPESKNFVKNSNILTLMDFLITKNIAFKKL